jgi:Arc/MetJ-type ribon-helix-helix transcriptional regulator
MLSVMEPAMTTTERLVLDLPADLVATLRTIVKSGAFVSESELVSTVLQAWYGPDDLDEQELNEIRAAVAEGLAEADAGKFIDADDVHAALRARIKAIADRHE